MHDEDRSETRSTARECNEADALGDSEQRLRECSRIFYFIGFLETVRPTYICRIIMVNRKLQIEYLSLPLRQAQPRLRCKFSYNFLTFRRKHNMHRKQNCHPTLLRDSLLFHNNMGIFLDILLWQSRNSNSPSRMVALLLRGLGLHKLQCRLCPPPSRRNEPAWIFICT